MSDKLKKNEKRILSCLIEAMLGGMPAITARVEDLTGLNRTTVVRNLKSLEEKGFVTQPYKNAPWMAIRLEGGLPVKLVLATGQEEPEPRQPARRYAIHDRLPDPLNYKEADRSTLIREMMYAEAARREIHEDELPDDLFLRSSAAEALGVFRKPGEGFWEYLERADLASI